MEPRTDFHPETMSSILASWKGFTFLSNPDGHEQLQPLLRISEEMKTLVKAAWEKLSNKNKALWKDCRFDVFFF